MSDYSDPNPPAYPFVISKTELRGEVVCTGMTLRDFFAAHALAGMMRHRSVEDEAEIAYRLADALLAERAKEPGQ